MSHPCRHPHAATDRRAQRPLLLLPLVLALRELLDRTGEITIRQADLSAEGFMGLTEFATRTVWLDQALDDAEFRWTAVHELLHHAFGPSLPRHAALDDDRIEAATAAMLLDAAATLCLQVRAERIGEGVGTVDTPSTRRRLVQDLERLLAGAR